MDLLHTGWQTLGGGPPVPGAFHIETVTDPFSHEPVIGMVRHTGTAFVAQVQQPAQADDATWQALAMHYLRALSSALQLSAGQRGWLSPAVWRRLEDSAAGRSVPPGLAWLPITWGRLDEVDDDPTGSFWLARPGAGLSGDGSRDGTLVLLAGCMRHQLQFGSDMGLRLAIHLQGERALVLGVTLSGLSHDQSLHSAPLDDSSDAPLRDLLRRLKPAIGQALGGAHSVWLRGLERVRTPGAPDHRLRASGYLLRPTQAPRGGPRPAGVAPGRARVRDFCVDLDAPPHAVPVVVAVRRDDDAGSAAGVVAKSSQRLVRAFLRDGASQGPADTLHERRPTADEAVLQRLQQPVQLLLQARTLAYARLGQVVTETRGARRVPEDISASTVDVTDQAVVQLGKPGGAQAAPRPVWTDEQAAIEAHVRAAELIDRMVAYGLEPAAAFRFARLPLVQRVRSAIPWAPDGDVPYAEVRPFIGDDEAEAQTDATGTALDPETAGRLQLLVKYGSADPTHRRHQPLRQAQGGDHPARTRAQFLSVASDPRWAWHEFGHVLNFASTGELEFPFAHSAGDALGAIALDPLSGLATAAEPEHPLRFASFPWIQVPGRSHGQAAMRGFCWCGARNQVRLDLRAPLERHHHGYFEEQLLSSSLFRLYRSLGGDTRATGADATVNAQDTQTRLAAADHCMLLVMRAIALLGPDSVAPARTADQFVSALVDADAGAGDWTIQTHWPLDALPRTVQRQGGRVHKLIRWAFERQGLYATDQPREVAEGPGLAPAVDIYIADSRPQAGPDAGPGSYQPVPLRWEPQAPWLADDGALQRRAGGDLQLRIGNRGRDTADQVQLRWWWSGPRTQAGFTWHAWPVGGATQLQVPPSGLWLPLLPGLPGEAHWLLACVDAPADRANLQADEAPPSDAELLMHLVAHDNNLALWCLEAPAQSLRGDESRPGVIPGTTSSQPRA